MPFPREDTTPPGTKRYFVELGLCAISPALDKRASELPPAEDLRWYQSRAAPPLLTGPPRWSTRYATPATAPAVRPARPDSGATWATGLWLPGRRRRSQRAASRAPCPGGLNLVG